MRRRDSIVEDLHKLRERIARAHGFDADRIAATIRRNEQEGVRAVVRTVPRRVTRQNKAS